MKRLLLLFLLYSCITNAQVVKGTQEVFISAGRISFDDMVFSSGNSRDKSNVSIQLHTIYMAGFKYYVKPRLAVGISVAQHSFAESYHHTTSNTDHYFYSDAVAICPEVKLVYLNSRSVQLYGTVAAGVLCSKGQTREMTVKQKLSALSNDFSVLPALYASPIGIRLGGQLSIFGEAGLGFRGIFNAGLCYCWSKTLSGKPHKRLKVLR